MNLFRLDLERRTIQVKVVIESGVITRKNNQKHLQNTTLHESEGLAIVKVFHVVVLYMRQSEVCYSSCSFEEICRMFAQSVDS